MKSYLFRPSEISKKHFALTKDAYIGQGQGGTITTAIGKENADRYLLAGDFAPGEIIMRVHSRPDSPLGIVCLGTLEKI